MADPITIIGTAGALANIIDVLAKVMGTVSEYQKMWQEADLAALNLESQLAALSTALNKIKAWTDSSFQVPHHQLVIDLDRCMLCCRTLISKIDVEVSQFQVTAENRLDVASKFRLLLKTRDFENVQRMIEQQTGALTLLLVACNTTLLSEQKGFLEQPQTRKIFKKMQDDTASLYVHRDVDSLVTATATSITSSKRSIQFDFDAELFISRIYEKWIRGSVKKSLHHQQSETPYLSRTKLQSLVPKISAFTRDEEAEQKKRSQRIDKDLVEDGKTFRNEWQILMLGDESRSELVEQMKLVHFEGYSEKELYRYRSTIIRSIYDSAKAVARAMRQYDVAPDSDPVWEHVDFIAKHVPGSDSTYLGLNLQVPFKEAVEAILESPYYLDLMTRRTGMGVNIPDSAEYFLAEIGRISGPEYLPNEVDVLRTRAKATAMYETWFQMGRSNIHMFDVGGQRRERKKLIQYFENVTSIIFVIDLATYDQKSLEESSHTRMMESLLLFDSVVNSPGFARTSIILFLANFGLFTQKLASSPLANYFPDYIGGNDAKKAAKYILWRCSQLNKAHLDFYPYLGELSDTSKIRLVFAAVQETIINRALKESNFL